ncbi:MAG TPA: hypothetical protein VHQ23_15020 [Ilumatobacteraceae bacterium]|nr:hypothetical protein [Ilumatobacteraceae bacterium]
MTDTLPAPDLDDIDVHDWLGRVEVDVNFATHGPTPLATVCAAAVDPLEIAVALEVAGISHAVATGRYNRADVFSIARMLWGQIPLRPTSSAAPVLPRSGDRSDLARGLLYVLPALMLLALTSAFHLTLAQWVLPLAISWGWGIGQVSAFIGYRMQVGVNAKHEATVMLRVLLAAMAATVVVSTIAALIFGGGTIGVIAATGLVTYMVASAILLMRLEEKWLAVLLAPGTAASIIVLAINESSLFTQWLAAIAIGGSFVAVVFRAVRHARLRAGGIRPFSRHDVFIASGHLLHGILCGLALSIIVIRVGGDSRDNDFARMLLPVPLLATLGVMEWQLRTFRSRIAKLTNSLGSALDFPKLAWREFLRSCVICVSTTASTAVAVVIAVQIHGGTPAISAMSIECVLAAVFFSDLILVLLDRLGLVLRSWIIGVAVGSVTLTVLLISTTTDTDLIAFWAGCALVSAVLIALLVHARAVVSIAMNH